MDIAESLAGLSAATIFELRGEWRRLHRTPPPMRLSRDLLTRGISYKLQERAYGGLSMAAARKLEQAAAGPPSRGAAKPTPSVSLRPGTRLVREWHGVTHTALIHADVQRAIAEKIHGHIREVYGWETWIRTKINGVRVRSVHDASCTRKFNWLGKYSISSSLVLLAPGEHLLYELVGRDQIDDWLTQFVHRSTDCAISRMTRVLPPSLS
jgi:hypothetical protein